MSGPQQQAPAPSGSGATRSPGFITIDAFATAWAVATDPEFTTPDMAGHLKRLQQASGLDLGTIIRVADNAMFFMAGERHARARSALLRVLGHNRLSAWQPMISGIVADCLDGLARAAQPDLIRDFSRPIFIRSTRNLMGLAPADPETFDAWTSQLQTVLEPLLPLRKILALQRGFESLLQQVRQQDWSRLPSQPRPLLAELLADPPQGFDRDDLEAMVLILYGASINLEQTLGNALLDLLQRPRAARRHAADPQWLDAHLEALLRHNASPRYIYRIATRAKTVGEYTFIPGDNILLHLPVIHRNPEAFPARDDGTPEPAAHLVFGRGLHRCIGASLTRLVMRLAIPPLFQRFPDLAHTGGPPEYQDNSQAIALKSLPCSLHIQGKPTP